MIKPVLSTFGPTAKLVPFELEQQVVQHGFVVFSSVHSDETRLIEETVKRLKKMGIKTIHGIAGAPNHMGFVADAAQYSSTAVFTQWVTEHDAAEHGAA